MGKVEDVICTECAQKFQGELKQDLLGIRKTKCPSCGKEVKYPLTGGTFGCYISILILFGLIFIVALINGRIAFPGIIAILVVVALVQNADVKKKLEIAKKRNADTPPPPSAGQGDDEIIKAPDEIEE